MTELWYLIAGLIGRNRILFTINTLRNAICFFTVYALDLTVQETKKGGNDG